MKNFNLKSALIAIWVLALIPVFSNAQTQRSHEEKCLAHVMMKEMLATDPSFVANQAQLEQFTQQYIDQRISNQLTGNASSPDSLRIIPVVFHIIHEGGSENISREQCLDQIDSLNKDFRRLNADAALTPAVFQSVGADTEIEFRLATLDPNQNCTDGITRTYSTLTNNARNNVKGLIYWPRNMYLNIWVVKSIENTAGSSGTVLGFAQFPGSPNPLWDGVVLRSDVVGSIGTAGWSNDGRTLTHEVGHWLNLRHIWGDATCGSDFVADTPTHQDANNGCPNWPVISTICNNGPNGEMYSNYMDYTNGSCQNIFTQGQRDRMRAALLSTISGRNNLWQQSNLIATGTDSNAVGAVCNPIAEFTNNKNIVCEGTTIDFTDGSWNSPVTSWQWDFPGGTPSTSTDQNPSVQYNTAGTYDVTLTVTNSAGTDSYTAVGNVTVVPAVGQNSVPYNEGFESTSFPGFEWIIGNDGGNAWSQSFSVAHTGSNSVFLNNFSGNVSNSTDYFVTPTYDLTNVTQANLYFYLAFAARTSTSTDNLKVFASTTCGQLWNVRYNKTGTTLSTAGIITSNFIPTAAQWRQETVNISSSSYNNKPNVRFKFEYNHSNGNNMYIDDLNLDGLVGLNEVMEESLDFSVYPNPVQNQASIDFTLTEKGKVLIDVIDVMGRVVNTISETTLDAGEYQFELPMDLAAGLYSVRLNVDGYVSSRKVIIQ